MTKGPLLISAMLVLASGAGCASTTEKYCDALEDEQQTLIDLARSSDEPGGVSLAEGLGIFEDLRDRSPDDLLDEWDTFVFAWEGVVDAFEAAGTDPEDFRPGEVTPGVTPAQSEAIEGASAELGSPRVVDAGQGIQQHAKDVCKVDLAP